MRLSYRTLLIATCLIAAPISANAAPVTFEFTGSVIVASGAYSSVSIGALVSGTYTFDFANADPSQSSGTFGSTTSIWTSILRGGSFFAGSPPPVSSYIFSSTATVGAFTYATAAPTDYETISAVQAFPSPSSSSYQANEVSCVDFIHCSSSSLIGNNGIFGGAIIYTSEGLPQFSATPSFWTGQFSVNSSPTFDDYLRFQITSLTLAVPEPDSLVLIALVSIAIGLTGVRLKTRDGSSSSAPGRAVVR